MTDNDNLNPNYRLIAQDYAKGGIHAVILLNSGALVATLTQLQTLLGSNNGLNLAEQVKCASTMWITGTLFGTLAWLGAFLSAHRMDLFFHARDEGKPKEAKNNRMAAICFMYCGIGSALVSLACFAGGALTLLVTRGVVGGGAETY